MKLRLKNDFIQAFGEKHKASHPALSKYMLGRIERFGEETVSFDTRRLAEDHGEGMAAGPLEDLIYAYAKETRNQGVMMAIGSVRLALKDVKRAKPGSLPALQAALVEYFKEDVIDGWVYKKNPGDDKFLPFTLVKTHLEIPSKREKEEGAVDTLYLSFTANSTAHTVRRGSGSGRRSHTTGTEYDNVSWVYKDLSKKRTVPELLLEAGLYHETAELKADYVRQSALYDKYRPRYAEQFVTTEGAYEEEIEDEKYHRTRGRHLTQPTKYINDDMAGTRPEFAPERDNDYWVEEGAPADKFRDLPIHPYLRMFNLTSHTFAFLHVDDVQPYRYDPTLRDKIVLPETHRDLIDVLVGDLAEVAGDVVAGKGGGTSILCQGGPGLGKTLTAEIYSEVKAKPLYRVHSGQLGIGAEAVEESLKVIFDRAQRWQCILLLDEADVYIRRRGDDLEHNAVVASFLRTMEYFCGIFFMTTNRTNDVDDAIASRCLAIITYEMPDAAGLGRIFQIHSDNFGSKLTKADLATLVELYTGKMAGRDAKMLLELATRYAAKKGVPVTAETVRMLAQFKGF